MINRDVIEKLANRAIKEMDLKVYIADILVKSDTRIYIFLDSDDHVIIEDCIRVSKFVEGELDREKEDFELNVSSYGANQPLKFPRQYVKNIGRTLELVNLEDEEFEGELVAATETEITLMTTPKKKKDLPQEVIVTYNEIKEAKIKISFK